MRTILFILCAWCLATGCGYTPQPLKPSPAPYQPENTNRIRMNDYRKGKSP